MDDDDLRVCGKYFARENLLHCEYKLMCTCRKQGCKEQNQLMCVNAFLFSKPRLKKCIHILFIKTKS